MSNVPQSGQGIDVGDAVFSFLGDTQSFDAAMNKVDTVPGRIQPAEVSVANLNDTLQGLGTYFGQAGEEATVAGAEIEAASERSAFSMREARGEAALLGEEMGIHLPRHVLGFVAKLPGVGEALSAAFSATAVLFLIQALIQGAEKLTAWISDTFIFTEAMKASSAAIGETNKQILIQNALFVVAKKTVEEFGKTAAEVTQNEIDELTKSIAKNGEEVMNAQNQIYGLKNGFVGVTGSVADAENKINLLTQTLKAQNEQLTALQQKQVEEAISMEEKRIEIEKAAAESRITLSRSEAVLKLAIIGGNYSQVLAVQNAADNALLQLEMRAITQRISALSFEGDKTKQERQALYAQLEKLVNDHNAKVFESYAEVFNKIREEAKTIEPELAIITGEISNDITKSLEKASQAAADLGFVFTGDVYSGLQSTKKAYEELQKSGRATYADLLQGQMAVLRATIAYNREFGQNTTDDQKNLNKLQVAFDKLTGTVTKTHHATHDMFAQMKLDLQNGVSGMQELKDIGGQAFNDLGKGIESAIGSAILGQAAIGDALKQATAAALASIASQALVKALFYTGEGFAAMAGFEEQSAGQYFAAAGIMASVGVAAGVAAHTLAGGSSSAGGSNSAPADNSAAVQASASPTNSVNVQRFATGGLVTKPTLAVIGDALNGGGASEVALPIDHPTTMKKIVEAFSKAGLNGNNQPTTVIHVQGLISADNLNKVAKKLNAKVAKNQITLKSSDAQRLTKRSN